MCATPQLQQRASPSVRKGIGKTTEDIPITMSVLYARIIVQIITKIY